MKIKISFWKNSSRTGTSKEKKKPLMPLPYTKRSIKVTPARVQGTQVPFVMNLFYKFSFGSSASGPTLTAKLSDHASKIKFQFGIVESQKPAYTVKLGASTSARAIYSSLDRVVRRRQFHQESNYGAANHPSNAESME